MKKSGDYPLLSRPIVGFEDDYPAGFVDPPHSHSRSQVSYAASGVISFITENSSFILPPKSAIWISAGVEHEVHCRAPATGYTLYIDPALNRDPSPCRVFEVSELVKALIFEVGHFPIGYDLAGREGVIAHLLLDEIMRMPVTLSAVAMPRDPRLQRVCRILLDNPADQRDIDDWAAIAGMARRTFTRAFRDETGAGLAVWRQQVRLRAAIALLAQGQPITSVAFEVGYETPSAFSAMFHRVFGQTPSVFLAQSRQRQTALDAGLRDGEDPLALDCA